MESFIRDGKRPKNSHDNGPSEAHTISVPKAGKTDMQIVNQLRSGRGEPVSTSFAYSKKIAECILDVGPCPIDQPGQLLPTGFSWPLVNMVGSNKNYSNIRCEFLLRNNQMMHDLKPR